MKAAKITGAAGQALENLPNRRKAAPSRRNPLPNPPGAPAGPTFLSAVAKNHPCLFVIYLLVIIIFAFMMNEAEEGTRTQPNAFGGPSEGSETQPNAFGGPSEASETQPNEFGGPSEASET